MSTLESPLTTALSTLSLNSPRVSVEATINSDALGIKTFLAEYFSGAKLFATIQRTDAGTTKATLQGHPKQFPSSLEYLKGLLNIKYDAAIVWGEPSAVTDENRFKSIIIENTLPKLKRDPSSGEFLDKELDEISFGGSAATEQFKKFGQSIANTILNGVSSVGQAKGLIPVTKKEHISVEHKGQEFDLEVSTLLSVPALIQAVQDKFKTPVPIKLLYRLHNEKPVVVTDVKDLREGFLYYVLTVNEELPKKQTASFSPLMEEFFSKLKTDEGLVDDEISIIKDCFAEQKIKFPQLMKKGDLAFTDGQLKEYGIKQGGLRIAILSVIKSSQ